MSMTRLQSLNDLNYNEPSSLSADFSQKPSPPWGQSNNNSLLFLDVLDTQTHCENSHTTKAILKPPPKLPKEKLHQDIVQTNTAPQQHCTAKTRKTFRMSLRNGCDRSFVKRSTNRKRHRKMVAEQTKARTVLPYIKHL